MVGSISLYLDAGFDKRLLLREVRRREEETANLSVIYIYIKKKKSSKVEDQYLRYIFFGEGDRLISLMFTDVYKAAEYWMEGTSEILDS